MWFKSQIFLVSVVLFRSINGFIINKNDNCPKVCTCKLEHLTENAIYRFMQQKDRSRTKANSEASSVEFNEVFNDDTFDQDVLQFEKSIVRSAICILQTETEPLDLVDKLPEDIETLTVIQGYNTGNKTVKFSHLNKFKNLISVELLGPNMFNKLTNSNLIGEIDVALTDIKFVNLENILIRNSKDQIQTFLKDDTTTTFQYVQRTNGHSLTMVQEESNENVLPYDKYKKNDISQKVPLFIGFTNLMLLRIAHCDLNNVHWTMFDGLQNLQHLILERNNIRFIPPFAFYGTPNLKTLSLAHNDLLDIQITDLAGLFELEYLDLSFNNFSQLSELSLPPFPKLKLADFGNNPVTVIFPNTFEVMNTTDSLIIGSDDVHLSLMTNSFAGLNLLKALTLINLSVNVLKRDHFVGMPNLIELTLTGNVTAIEYDTFLEVYKLKTLIMTNCKIRNISMDAFIGLENLEILDLSRNELEYLPPVVLDPLINIKEIYLNGNNFHQLPREIFSKLNAKLIRLNDNPWHCSCAMSEWKPMIVNKIKHKVIKQCDFNAHDKGVGCQPENRFTYKYVFENKIAPKCIQPEQYVNWSVFHVMRRLLKCAIYKPKFKKHHHKKATTGNYVSTSTTSVSKVIHKDEENELGALPHGSHRSHWTSQEKKQLKHKIRKIRKHNIINDNNINTNT